MCTSRVATPLVTSQLPPHTHTHTHTAMLTVEDDEFWADAEPVQFGSLPQLQAAVTVVGYPIGERGGLPVCAVCGGGLQPCWQQAATGRRGWQLWAAPSVSGEGKMEACCSSAARSWRCLIPHPA